MKVEKEYNIFDLTFYEASINDVYIVMVQSGLGKVNAARCTQILIDNIKVDYIFNIGVAGGIFCIDYMIGKKINNKFNALCVEMEGTSISQVCYLSYIHY